MKEFILGAQCSGKTTVANFLRSQYRLNIVEMDEAVRELYGGDWPSDDDYKESVLVPEVLKTVSKMPDVLFFENHMNVERTQGLRQAGFSVTVLAVAREKLLKRNQWRMTYEGYDDASGYIDGQLRNIEELQEHGLVDRVIDGERATHVVANQILENGMLGDWRDRL